MELTDYDILGITEKSSFRIVKHAYYELTRIYHPDSPLIILGMSKEERISAFQKIQQAYENIKEKLNVVEIDLPQEQIDYEDDKFDKPFIKKNENLNSKIDENFNNEFVKIYSQENKDNPYSIHYDEPEECKRNLPESKIILKEFKKASNVEEFGINHVEDHSSERYCDIRQLKISNSYNLENESIKEKVDLELDDKLEELIKIRTEKIQITEEEINFIKRQKEIQTQIAESKEKIDNNNKNKLFLN